MTSWHQERGELRSTCLLLPSLASGLLLPNLLLLTGTHTWGLSSQTLPSDLKKYYILRFFPSWLQIGYSIRPKPLSGTLLRQLGTPISSICHTQAIENCLCSPACSETTPSFFPGRISRSQRLGFQRPAASPNHALGRESPNSITLGSHAQPDVSTVSSPWRSARKEGLELWHWHLTISISLWIYSPSFPPLIPLQIEWSSPQPPILGYTRPHE